MNYKEEAERIHNTAMEIIASGRASEFLLSIGINDMLTDNYICDCEKNYGKTCKHPDRHKNEGCNG